MIARTFIESLYEKHLRRQCRHIPNHIAIIQDGNRRYAKLFGLDTADGHRAGADKTEEMLDWAQELGIRHITLYTLLNREFLAPERRGEPPLRPVQGEVHERSDR